MLRGKEIVVAGKDRHELKVAVLVNSGKCVAEDREKFVGGGTTATNVWKENL